MHKALYREYRPMVFEDVIGQDHIIKTLINQINTNNLSHAYLFCGTRGTGKTSTAKILARAVNCTHDGDKPCNVCQSCVSIMDASNLDVIEIDAASNNSVDDIRELRDTVKYTPNKSKYKVYIIDEVHMLSSGAFNALLKTLEEPPSYVIFILATTEPNKIPATILSRCQRFDFKRIGLDTLVDKMKFICQKENVDISDDALRLVAKNGQGSFMDSLSILDKCLSFSNGPISMEEVLDLLGAAAPGQLISLSESIIESDVARSMKLVDDYFMWGKDIRLLVEDLTSVFRSMMMMKIFNEADSVVEFNEEYRNKLLEKSKSVDTEEIIRILNLLSEAIDKLKQSTNQRMTLEIYIMKLASPATDDSYRAIKKRLEVIERMVEDGRITVVGQVGTSIGDPEPSLSDKSRGHMDQRVGRQDRTNKGSYGQETDLSSPRKDRLDQNLEDIDEEGLAYIEENWKKLLERLVKDRKMPLKAFLEDKHALRYKNHILYVVLSDGFSFAIERLKQEETSKYIKNVISEIYKMDIDVRFIVKDDMDKMEFSDPEPKQELGQDPAIGILSSLGDKLKIEK